MNDGAIIGTLFGSFFGLILFCALVVFLCLVCRNGCPCELNCNQSSNSTEVGLSRIEINASVVTESIPETPDNPPSYSFPMDSPIQCSDSQGVPLHPVEYSHSQGVPFTVEPVEGKAVYSSTNN